MAGRTRSGRVDPSVDGRSEDRPSLSMLAAKFVVVRANVVASSEANQEHQGHAANLTREAADLGCVQ